MRCSVEGSLEFLGIRQLHLYSIDCARIAHSQSQPRVANPATLVDELRQIGVEMIDNGLDQIGAGHGFELEPIGFSR